MWWWSRAGVLTAQQFQAQELSDSPRGGSGGVQHSQEPQVGVDRGGGTRGQDGVYHRY